MGLKVPKTMKCGKSCFLITFLLLTLTVSAFYLSKKLIHPIEDSPVITNADNMQITPPYPPIPQPAGNLEQALIVNTDPSTSCGPKELIFSVKQLQDLPQKTFKTKHTWAASAQEFSGPLIADVLKLVCPNAQDIYLRSFDQYSIMVNFSKIEKYEPILALKIDGQPLTIREKGPLWVMINTDGFNLPTRSLDSMFVWQLYYIRILTSH